MNKTADKIKKRDNAKDVFITPLPLVKKHLEYVKKYVRDGDIIYDPFFGTGNYYNTYNEYFKNNTFVFTEISMGLDFFDFHLGDKPVGAIISNPPYSMIDKVLKKSVELNPRVISYLIGLHNLTTKRIKYMNENGYTLVSMKMLKVMDWFGMSAIVVFIDSNICNHNCIDFDRTIYHSEK
jgi:hypothetical protein